MLRHTKTDSMSTAVPAHLGRPTALSWLFLPSFVSTYCFFFFFLSDQIHIGGQPEQYATQCRTTGGRPLDGIRNLSAGLLTSRLPDGTAGPSLTSRAQQPLPWTPQGSSVRLHKDVSWSPSSTADTFFEYYTHPQFSLNLYCVQRVFSSTSYRSKYIHMEWCSGAFYSKKKGRVRLFFVVTPWCCHEASSSGCYHPTWVTDVMDVEKRESSSW